MEEHENTSPIPIRMLSLPIEALSLCAYTDEHYGKHREYWRSFLKVLLPALLERDPAEVEELVEHSILREWTELIDHNDPQGNVGGLMRHISASLSLLVGHPAELGFASFLDCALPTKMHALPRVRRRVQAGHPLTPSIQNERVSLDEVFIDWFSRLSLVQSDDNFIRTVAQWQMIMHELPMTHFDVSSQDEALEARTPVAS